MKSLFEAGDTVYFRFNDEVTKGFIERVEWNNEFKEWAYDVVEDWHDGFPLTICEERMTNVLVRIWIESKMFFPINELVDL